MRHLTRKCRQPRSLDQAAEEAASPPIVPATQSTAICSGLPVHRGGAHPLAIMGTKSRETIYGASDPGGGRARDRKPARKPIGSPSRRGTSACSPFRVRAQPSPTLGDAINTGFDYLEVNALAAPSIGPLPSTPRAATEDNAGPLTETLHAMQGLLAGSAIPIVFVSNLAFPPDVPTHFPWSWLGQKRQNRWRRAWLNQQ